MISQTIQILINTIEEAPKYDEDTKLLLLETAIIVREGMESGKPSIDLQMVDKDGNRYLVMTTGAIIQGLSVVAQAIMVKEDGQMH